MSKKHLNSVLVCQMDDGTLNIYANGLPVLLDSQLNQTLRPVDEGVKVFITPSGIDTSDIKGILRSAANELGNYTN